MGRRPRTYAPLIALSVITAATAAGCASASTSAGAVSAATAASAPSSPDCGSQAVPWRDNGGLSQTQAVIADLGKVGQANTTLAAELSSGADASASESALQTAAASLQSDAQTAQANLPPACMPRVRQDESAALNYSDKLAIDCENAVSEIGSGNYTVAAGDIKAATTAVGKAGAKFSAAASDVNAFNKG